MDNNPLAGTDPSGQCGGFLHDLCSAVDAGKKVVHKVEKVTEKVVHKAAPIVAIAAVAVATIPLDETGTGEAIDASVIGGEVAADSASDAPVAIGEDMANRVQPYADSVGADTYQPDPSAPESSWEQNQEDWINKQMDDGRTIHDCGPSPAYPNFPEISSKWYGIERAAIASRNYPTISVDC